ncbi:MAG TPA: hypothetical protein VMV83_03315 [Rectinemataceae bacterium]|nr:hypothetical protein [Rectinemataceae bacterium]
MEKYRGSRQVGARFALVAALGFAIAAPGLFALDLSGRTDTGYRLDYGDNAMINRAWNTHSLDIGIMPGLKFSMYGGLDGSFGAAPAAGTVLISLPDAQNGETASWVDYDLYTASIAYTAPTFGLALGRLSNQPGAMASFDGLSAWVAPMSWLRVDLFGGLPYSDASLVRAANAYTGSNLEGGASLSANLFDEALNLSAGYVYLSQATPTAGTIAASANTVVNQVLRASASWSSSSELSAGASATLVNFNPVDSAVWVGGMIDAARLSYSLNGDLQFLNAADFGASLSNFAAILGAADPYLSASVDLSEDFGGFFLPKGGLVSSLTLDAGYDHRQPLTGSATISDPGYEQFRVGPSVSLAMGLALSGYYNYLLPASGYGTSINAFGGEIGQKVDAFDFRLGTSFSASSWQEDVAGVYTDSFAAQQYYLQARWKATKALNFQFKASYETSQQTSIINAFAGSSDLDASPRSDIHVELRAGYRY